MSEEKDPFEELQEEPKSEEKSQDPHQQYEDLKKYIADEFKKFGIKQYDFVEPFSKVRIKFDGEKVELTYNDKDAYDRLYGNPMVNSMFLKFLALKFTSLENQYNLSKLYTRPKK